MSPWGRFLLALQFQHQASQASPLEQSVSDPPVVKSLGYQWEQHMQGRMTDSSVLSQIPDSPPLYIYICARLKHNYCVYARHTHEHIVRKAYFPRYIMFACVWKETLSTCNEEEDGREVVR